MVQDHKFCKYYTISEKWVDKKNGFRTLDQLFKPIYEVMRFKMFDFNFKELNLAIKMMINGS